MTRAHRQHGFSIVSTIFLLVVLAALGVFAVRMGTLQQQTAISGLRAAQAFHAARSGVEWGAYRALKASVCSSTVTVLDLTEGGTSGYRVSVTCNVSVHTEGTSTVRVYVFDVRAEAGAYGQADYVSRRVQAKITDAV